MASARQKLLVVSVGAVLSALSSCKALEPTMAPLEIRALQTRTFDATKQTAFQAVLAVFQDSGYTIESADLPTGLISASSPAETSVEFFVGNKITSARATATVEEYPAGRAHVRINLVRTEETSSGYGMKARNDTPILDPVVYQNLFALVQQAIFVRSAEQ